MMRTRRRIIIGMMVTITHTAMQHFLRRVELDNKTPCMDEECDMFQIVHEEGGKSITCSGVMTA